SLDTMFLRFPEDRSLDDTFTLVELEGVEALSQLYRYRLHLVADPAKPVAFDQFLGRSVSIAIPGNGPVRHVGGIIRQLTQERRDQNHIHYRAEVVPRLWALTRTARSRIFQDVDVKEIVDQLIKDLTLVLTTGVSPERGIQGDYPRRPYCVQYRETDFNFLSRILEEEGIYYFFGEQGLDESVVFSDAPITPPAVPHSAKLNPDEVVGGNRPEERVTAWRKTQEVRSGKYTLRDHSFELPTSPLEASRSPTPTVRAGSALHRFDKPFRFPPEVYDYPGGYAERFDGVNRGGGDKAAALQGVYPDGERTAAIRMQQEAFPGLVIEGASNCRHFQPGFQFTLQVQDPASAAVWKA